MQSLSLSLILISIHPRNLTVHYSYYFLAVVLLSSSVPSYLSSLFWASLSRSSTLQIVSSVHHLTSSAIPHIFNIIERHQKKSSSSSGIKQTGTLAAASTMPTQLRRALLCGQTGPNWSYLYPYPRRTSFMLR